MNKQTMDQYTISDVVKLTGITAYTLRYYENIGLVHPVMRKTNGHREYELWHVEWLKFVNCLRATGMPLKDIERYAKTYQEPRQDNAARIAMLVEHRQVLVQRIVEMNAMLGMIDHKLEFLSKK